PHPVGGPPIERLQQLLHRVEPPGLSGLAALGSLVSSSGAATADRIAWLDARWPASADAAASPPRRTSLERMPARISPRRSRLATVPAGTKSSTYGSAARIPPASGS